MLKNSMTLYSNKSNFERFKVQPKTNNVLSFKANLKPVIDTFEKQALSHADIVVTHSCNMHCNFCIDQFRNTSSTIISLDKVESFLKLLKTKTSKTNKFKYDQNPVTEVLLLGGEPTMAGSEHLNKIAQLVHKHGFEICVSTNGIKKDVIEEILPNFDWVQVTCRSDKQIDYWRKFKDKVNIKLAGDADLTLDKFKHFVEYTKDFPRRSLTMYFKPNFEEVCKDKGLQDYLNKFDWEEQGSYLYTFVDGVRVKKCIPSKTNFIDEPLIPKLYPNGNYNKTWQNELNDPYIGEL